MKWLRTIHTVYGVLIFAMLFLVMLPFLLIPVIFPSQHHLVGIINRWWARLLFLFVFVPVRVEYRSRLDPQKVYIFCPNHFSYIDIPAMGLNAHNAIFVGKSEVNRVPLFGFMYRKLHITVDRSSLKSRFHTLKHSLQAIDEGKSLVIFPEGGIVTERDPVMGKFKDGAFRAAIEKQIPIVPVTIPYNWIILPADQFLLHWHPLKVIFHEPIDTAGLTVNDIDALKEKVYRVINETLRQHLELYADRSHATG
jgi:1-acyl-sn-glycerol-3-phosphate acyltransferase